MTIADYEPGEQTHVEDNTDLEMIEDTIDENDLGVQEEVLEPVVEEGIIIVPEVNIISEEEDFF